MQMEQWLEKQQGYTYYYILDASDLVKTILLVPAFRIYTEVWHEQVQSHSKGI